MVLEPEAYKVASQLIGEYGEMARIGALIKVDQLRDRGDEAGSVRWIRVVRAVEELLRDDVPADAVRN
nr:conserved uncharacterized protein [uncultured bacterium]